MSNRLSLPLFVGVITSGLLAGCATTGLHKTNVAEPGSYFIANVPFHPDNTNQCGPASLAAVMNYWGKETTPEQLKKEVFVDRLGGTLPLDMMPALRARNLSAHAVHGSFDLIKEEIRNKRPVIAYLDFGTKKRPIGHYVVVTGYDDDRRGLIFHSGLKANKFASYKRFNRGWSDTDRWMLIVGPDVSTYTLSGVPAAAVVQRLSADDHVRLGQIYETKGLKSEALEQYERALTKDEHYVPGLVALGNNAFQATNYKSALKYFKRAVAAEPDHGGANNNIAMTYLMLGKNLERAEGHARIALKSPAHAQYAEDTLKQIHIKRTGRPPTPQNVAVALKRMNNINRMELDMATVAKDRWSREDVRSLAYDMHTDHKLFQEKLEALAEKLDVELITDEPAAEKRDDMIARLRDVENGNFDRAFAQMIAENHARHITHLTTTKKKLSGPARKLVDEMLPVIKKHQQVAKKLTHDIKND